MEITEHAGGTSRPSALVANGERRSDSASAVAAWLLACCAMLFAMIVVGGVTRLTHSGLSITEWQPIVGTLPPLSAQDWNDAFAKYQATPEYREVNRGMDLQAFKGIFWWEYAHRLLGRAIGVVFIVPLLWFIARRKIPPGYGPALATLFVLGGAQGALGWYMVQSGLVDDPRVSQLRLTAHLGLAIAIFGAMWWIALSLLRPSARTGAIRSPLLPFALAIVALVFVMVLSGGLVAGIRAGFAYNTFPRMNGAWVPPEIMMIEPWYRNFYENMATVQFDHRLMALLLALSVAAYWWRARRAPSPARGAAWILGVMLVVQVALGISTLLLVVPVGLAALHQAGAVLVFAAAINAAHAARSTGPRV
ncbi:MAG TPA: COX15/CtaA family protein [Casimicrobiaceae bacterium]